jgi:hypothetical protein
MNSCQAPHSNPLDPENPDSGIFYYIEGKITRFDEFQHIPVPVTNLKVSLEKEGIYGVSDNNGYYKIKCFKRTDQNLILEGDKIFSDTLPVKWADSKNLVINANVVYKPEPDSLINNTIINWDFGDEQVYEYSQALYIKIYMGKIPAGMVETIKLVNEEFNINYTLYNDSLRTLEATIPIEALKLKDLSTIIGKKFSIYINAVQNKSYKWKDIVFNRFITESVTPLIPVNSSMIDCDTLKNGNISFSWKPYNVFFDFLYQVEITKKVGNDVVSVVSSNKLSKDITSVDLRIPEYSENKTQYIWKICCIDQFNNVCKSIPYTLIKIH